MYVHDLNAVINTLDWDFLIILDACRYDVFSSEFGRFLEGRLMKAHSPASNSTDFANRVWTKFYYLTYFSANPLINSKGAGLGFNGPGHFSHVIDVWDFGYSDKLGTVPAVAVNMAFNNFKHVKKAVLHYMQPHGPWIGETKIVIPGEGWMNGNILKRLKVTRAHFQKAYRDNLRHVLGHVRDLIPGMHGKIVITSDHGELLGEYGRYCHAGKEIAAMDVAELRMVPWFVIVS